MNLFFLHSLTNSVTQSKTHSFTHIFCLLSLKYSCLMSFKSIKVAYGLYGMLFYMCFLPTSIQNDIIGATYIKQK